MEVVKVFSDGENQRLNLPKDFQFDTEEVAIKRVGNGLLLMPIGETLSGILESLDMFTDDFMEGVVKDLSSKECEAL